LQKFTPVQLLEPEHSASANSDFDFDERVNWNNRAHLEALQMQLQELKTSFNKGDMNNSKKIFAQQSLQTLGKESHHKIQSAMRQYDLVLAEAFLDEVLGDISELLSTGKQ